MNGDYFIIGFTHAVKETEDTFIQCVTGMTLEGKETIYQQAEKFFGSDIRNFDIRIKIINHLY